MRSNLPRRKIHLAVAELYIDVMQRVDHPLWKYFHYNPSNWREYFSRGKNATPPEFRKKISYRFGEKRHGYFVSYIARCVVLHCQNAAERQDVDDPLWKTVLEKVVLDERSAFAFSCVGFEIFLRMPALYAGVNDTWPIRDFLGEYNGKFGVLHSHVFPVLGIAREGFDVRIQQSLGQHSLNSFSKSLIQQAGCISVAGTSALHVAVSWILEAARHFLGVKASISLLIAGDNTERIPFVDALFLSLSVNRRVAPQAIQILQTLVIFEDQHAGCILNEESPPWVPGKPQQ
jgi:hypothetical protein